jgi:fatty-acyl-CoA synthase
VNIPLTPIRFLRYAEEQFPDRTAVVCGDEYFTYRQFARRVSLLAGGLRKQGIKKGSRVAILSPNCHRFLEAYYAVLEVGCILLPLNTRLAATELAYLLKDSGAAVLFFDRAFLETVRSLRQSAPLLENVFILDGPASEAGDLSFQSYEDLLGSAAPYRADIMGVAEDATAEIFYTSGTTATPKGVMLTHRNVYLHTMNHYLTFNTDKLVVHLHTIPLFHVNGWGAAHYFYIGAKHVMIRRFNPPEVLLFIDREGVTSIALVPTMAMELVNSPVRTRYNLKSLERIRVGGAVPSPTLVREVENKLGGTCFGSYGLTETSPSLTSSTMKPGLHWEGDARYEGQAQLGFAIPGVEIRVVDANLNDVPHDGKTMGEIVARSDGLMAGYWGNPQATAEAMQGGWFHTEDLGTINDNGYLRIVDRKKDIIISGGENVSSLELENTLLAHPAVCEAAIIAVPDMKWGEVPKAFVVLKGGMKSDEKELIDFCRSRLSHYKAPRSVEFVPSLPKTATGKVLKRELHGLRSGS